MAECHSLDYLIYKIPKSLGVDPYCILLQNFKQILLYIFKHKIQSAFPKQSKFKLLTV